MSNCQRCWADAHLDEELSVGEKYEELVADCNCTSEQQAGLGAKMCPYCRCKTIHELTDEPMCGCLD